MKTNLNAWRNGNVVSRFDQPEHDRLDPELRPPSEDLVELDPEKPGQLRSPSDDVELIHQSDVSVGSNEVVVDHSPPINESKTIIVAAIFGLAPT